MKNPEILRKLTKEIRDAFRSPEDITINRLAEQKYLIACFDEGLRMFPTSSDIPPSYRSNWR